MITFDKALKQARDALAILPDAKIALGIAYMDLEQDTDWDGQSAKSILEAQELLHVLRSAYDAIEG